MKNARQVVLCILLASLLAAACSESGGGDDDAAATEGVKTVTFGGSSPASVVGLLSAVIESEGIDEAHGIDLEVSESDPAAAEQALVTGQFDVGFLPLLTMARVQAEGVPLRFLMPLQTTHASVVVPADSPVEELEDLRGMTVGSLGPASGMSTSMEILTAERGGIIWPDDFEVVQGPPPALLAFIDQGETDAVMHFEPFVTRLLVTGEYRQILSQNEAYREVTGEDLILSGIAAGEEWIEDDPDRARAVIDMLREGMAFIQGGGPEILQPYEEEFALTGEDLDAAFAAMAPLYTAEDPSTYEEGTVEIFEASVDLGLIEEFAEPVYWPDY